MDKKAEMTKFLSNNKLLSLATLDEEGKPWACNVYFGVDDAFNLFWVSSEKTNHSKHIKNNSSVAFSVAWFNPDDDEDIASVQGVGVARKVNKLSEAIKCAKSFQKKFPGWKDWFEKELLTKLAEDRLYIVKPTYIKFMSVKTLGKGNNYEYKADLEK